MPIEAYFNQPIENDPYSGANENDAGAASFSDYAKDLGAATLQTGSTLAAGARASSDATNSPNAAAIWKFVQDRLDDGASGAYKSMSPAAQKQLHASITSEDFWNHPISSAILQGVDMTPSLAATIAPALLLPESGTAGVAAVAGALGASQSAKEVYDKTDQLSDEEFQKDYPFYAKLRASGMDEDKARAKANTELMGFKPIVNAAANAGAMLLGPAGRVAGLVPEEAGAGLLKRAGVGAAEAGVGMGAMSGVGEATSEQTDVDLHQRSGLDPDQILAASVAGGLQGVVMGAVGGAATGHEAPGVDLRTSPETKNVETKNVEKVDARAPDAEQTVALKPDQSPPQQITQPGKPEPTQEAANAPAPPNPSVDTVHPSGVLTPSVVPGGYKPVPWIITVDGKDISGAYDIATANNTLRKIREAYPNSDVKLVSNLVGAKPDTAQNDIVNPIQGAEPNIPTPKSLETPASGPVPESGPTLQAQRDQLVNGQRRAMLYPKGGDKPPAAPDGMKSAVIKDGVVHFNPDVITYKEVMAANKAKRLNDILDLGDYSKKDLEPRLAAGEAPVAVTERTPTGTEVKAAAGTTGTMADQVKSLEGTKTPGNTVQVESVPKVIQDRINAAKAAGDALKQKEAPAEPKPRVRPPKREVAEVPKVHEPHADLNELPAPKMAEISSKLEKLWQVAEQQEAAGHPMQGGIEPFIERKRAEMIDQARAEMGMQPVAKGTRAAKTIKNEGKHYTAKQLADRAANNAKAKEVVDRFPPVDGETHEQLTERLGSMLKAANDAGVKVPNRLKDITNKEMEHNSAAFILNEARNLAGKEKISPDDIAAFQSKERILRTGREEDRRMALEQRRAENEEKYSRHKDVNREASPEEEIAAERERLEEIPDESIHEEGSGTEEGEEPEEANAGEARQAAGTDRPKVTLQGNEVLAGKDRAGTFKVEKPKRRTWQIKKRDEGKQDLRIQASEGRKLENAIRGKSIHQVAAYLKDNAPRPADREIAAHVERALGAMEANGMKFGFHVVDHDVPPDMGKNSLGMAQMSFDHDHTNPRMDIHIRSTAAGDASGMDHETILHELLHAVSNGALHLGRTGKVARFVTFRNDMLNLRAALLRDLQRKLTDYENGNFSAMTKFEHDMLLDNNNALADEHELLSWGLTNEEMQDTLERMKYKTGSYLNSFVQSIRALLGLPLKSETGLTELIRLTHGLFNDQAMAEQAKGVKDFYRTPFAPGTNLDAAHRVNNFAPSYMRKAGDFTPAGNVANTAEVNGLFQEHLTDAMTRGVQAGKDYVAQIAKPGEVLASTIGKAKDAGSIVAKAMRAVVTNTQWVEHGDVPRLLPMAHKIFDNIERIGVEANKLKEEGMDLTGAMIRAQKQNPGLFAKFAELVHEQTMVGADASTELGVGRNEHLRLPKAVMDKIEKGTPLSDVENEGAMRAWEARGAHEDLQRRYNALTRAAPEYAKLQESLFSYYERAQADMARGQTDAILKTYGFKGTDAERAELARRLTNDDVGDDERKTLADKFENDGEQALKHIDATDSLKIQKGPYAPLMRRGEHAIVGEYKVPEPANGRKIDDDTYEFKDRDAAHAFTVKAGLHAEPKSVYYDTATGKKVASKSEAISQVGEPEQRFQVKLNRQHLEFHERASDARARLEELQKSGLFEKLGLEERRHIESESSGFNGRGVDSLLRSLSAQKAYQDATELERATLRHTIKEAGLRSMSDNRVQSRRLPRRFVQGASDDVARNLYEYNNSQANYRARLKYQNDIDTGLKAMWDHVKENRYSPDNEARSAAANEVERRARAQDPSQYSGAYTEWTRRLSTWSYIDRMMRPSHLILHQTHLPMITAPYMVGRHGIKAFGSTLAAWKELTGFYAAGGHDAWATTWGSALQKGADYGELAKKAFARAGDGKRLAQMIDSLSETGIIHPSAGLEVHKYMPSKQLGGIIGGLDHGLNKVDTIFRHLTNSTEAINRIAGATAAYRLEFAKLTRMGKSESVAHQGAVEYARQTLHDTQGQFSATNAAPIFKNKFLKPFLQFKQFPQMMYHLISKLAIQSLKGETREAKVQALASLGSILGMHMMMAGVLQGLPLEAFKLLGLISKGIGLTDGDWSDVENAVTRSINNNFGKETGNIITHGLGAQLGVDVHHRLGLNSFVTYGMPEQLDSKSVSEFVLNAAAGAPGGLVKDAIGGVHQMLNGDIEGGALKAAPLQALRDVHNAISPAPNKYGYQATSADRVKSLLGFTPEAKAAAAEKKEAVYNAVQDYNTHRSGFIKSWVGSPPGERDQVWDKIQAWNASQPPTSRINKGDLFRSLANAGKPSKQVDFVNVNKSSKAVAERAADLYQ